MYNQVILIGNLTKNPELRRIPSGKEVATADLATNKKWKDQQGNIQEQAQFHKLVIWDGAETFCSYLNKGSKVFISGELTYRNYKNKEGNKVYITEIKVNEFKFLDSFNNKEAVKKEKKESDVLNIDDLGEELEDDNKIDVSKIPF